MMWPKKKTENDAKKGRKYQKRKIEKKRKDNLSNSVSGNQNLVSGNQNSVSGNQKMVSKNRDHFLIIKIFPYIDGSVNCIHHRTEQGKVGQVQGG